MAMLSSPMKCYSTVSEVKPGSTNVNICVETSGKFFNWHGDAIFTNTQLKAVLFKTLLINTINFLQTMAIQLSPIKKLNLSNLSWRYTKVEISASKWLEAGLQYIG